MLLADPAHRRHKYYIEVYLPLLFSELFEVRDSTCLMLVPIVLNTVTCLQ